MAVFGRYIFPNSAPDLLEKTTVAGIGGERQLTEALDELSRNEGLDAFETDTMTRQYRNARFFELMSIASSNRGSVISVWMLGSL